MKKYLLEVEKSLTTLPIRTSAHNPEAYIGGGQSKLNYIGLRVPDLRNTFRKGYSFSRSPDVAKIWDFIWQTSNCYEVMSMPLIWGEKQKSLKQYWPMLKKWSLKIDNWAHSDGLSSLYARLHEQAPVETYKTFQQWNASENPWLRRLSIVSLFYYSSQRETFPSLQKVTSLLSPQLEFDHYYVQKGLGWTLREAGNAYPKDTYKYIEKNVTKISAHAFSAAIEKMSVKQKEHLKALRRAHRVSGT